jgi:hypothetical protein
MKGRLPRNRKRMTAREPLIIIDIYYDEMTGSFVTRRICEYSHQPLCGYSGHQCTAKIYVGNKWVFYAFAFFASI